MARDFKFDPVTQDWIPDGKGSFQTTEHADTMLMHQLVCTYRAWWGDGELGSRLNDPKNYGADPVTFAKDEARRAIGVLIDRGRVANLQVDAEQPYPGRVNVATRSQDVSTGSVVDTFTKHGGS